FLSVGQFDERLRSLEDLDWFIRFGKLGGRLHVVPHLDTIVLREGRARNYAEVRRACDLISDKFQNVESVAISQKHLRSLNAYLHLELAAAEYSHGRWGRAIVSFIKSFGARMRLQRSVRPYWLETQNVPLAIERAYDAMVQAADISKEPACEILIVVYS